MNLLHLMKSKFSLIVIFFTVSFISLLGIYQFKEKTYGFVSEKKLKDFSLKNLDEKNFRINSLKGNSVFLYFGYTNCKRYCPNSLKLLKKLADSLKENDVRFVFISIDSNRDKTEELTKLKKNFDERFIPLYGDENEVKQIAKEFSILYEEDKTNENELSISHSSRIFLISKDQEKYLIYPDNFFDLPKILEDYRYINNSSNH
ncbi:MAG: SCO family protein [Leptospiraceae bacterium]|nr:SCO family protein [Leptospiraceae bacterium]